MRYLLKFSYDGSNFNGFQVQKGLRTIQGVMEEAASKINNGKKTNVISSGRTDKKVHALEQIAHVDLDVNITPYKLKKAMNSNMPNDVHIIEALEVSSSFHARFQAKEKIYQYHINTKEYNPLRRNYCYQHNYYLDVIAMQEAINYLIGTHDYRAFVTESQDKENCIRTIYEASIKEDPYYDGELIFTFRGNGFLRYQVRNMVGALLKVGTSKIKPIEVKNILEGKIRGKNSATAPAEGLYLAKVIFK